VEQFRKWFQEARDAGLLEPNAMTLATADAAGFVNARTVLLKAYDDRGFVFFTNYGSRKAHEIAGNARVAVLFPWLALERQVAIRGEAIKISHAESLTYFMSRPVGSRIGAWVSEQSRAINSRKLLEAKFQEMMEKFRDGKVPLPDFWGGYRIEPHSFEFWQGGANRLHDRFFYSKTPQGNWEISRLQP
jgi:pyridoxamine 5'-phosphate oxidase